VWGRLSEVTKNSFCAGNITLISQPNITKSQMDTLSTYALLTASFFFVALSFALLLRYRQISQRINASNDLGHDLWSSLEQRLKKQDERILDVMGRVEVIQARVTSSALVPPTPRVASPPPKVPPQSSVQANSTVVTEPAPTTQQQEQPKSRSESQASQTTQASGEPEPVVGAPGVELALDETQLAALRILGGSPRDTRQLTDVLQKSREHTARLMKQLFELGLVKRDDSSKPFVYQLTDEGRRRLADNPPPPPP
jgi:DNA-binding transcriptional ArsR family regulator